MKKSFYIPPSGAPAEKAFLVGVTLPGLGRDEEGDNLGELELLAKTAGADVVGSATQSRTRIDGSTYIGGGKIEELSRIVYERGVNLVIFDDDLSPAQARNIESRLKINVIDRTELIMDIFARRARTKQAKIQVEIAQLRYALPRLRRLWEHLSRQAGGIGTRGPGETQLEVDRRKVRERISHLSRELRRISRGVGVRRKGRRKFFNATLVGYTNAGKSTLLNRLAGSRVLESGRLFSTLDSTTRRVTGTDGGTFLLTDTIGFIRKLPPHLVASFRATLMDVREADLLLHVADAADRRCDDRVTVVNSVLERVLAGPAGGGGRGSAVSTVLVLNKIDLLENDAERNKLLQKHGEAVPLSAARGDGCGELLFRIASHMERERLHARVEVHIGDGRAISRVEEVSDVMDRRVEGGRMIFDVVVDRKNLATLEGAGSVRIEPSSS